MYKSAVDAESAASGLKWPTLLDFGELLSSRNHEAITHHVDCETAIYDLCSRRRKTGSRPISEINSIRHLCPRFVFTLGQTGCFRQPAGVFRCACAVAGHGFLPDTGTVIYGEGHRRKTVKIGDHAVRTRQTIDAIVATCNGREPPPLSPEQALHRLRLPAEVSKPCHRT